MSTTMLLPTALPMADGSGVGPALAVLLSSGLVGMSIKNVFDSLLPDGEEEAGGEAEMADGGLMAEDDGDDAFGDLGGLEGDGDDMGGFGDDDMGEFGDMDGAAGADNDELEHRLDELETEVGSLSSTVNTVRTENEQISESVEEVEENVRKLLDIYEMVTRGVNPFADDIEAGMGGGGMAGEGSFGLFDDDGDDGDDGEEDIDDDIANADAEGFFDDDLVDDGGDDFGGGVDDMFDDGAGGDDAFEDDGGTFDEGFDDFEGDDLEDGDADDSGGDGKSFQELKDEYESGDAEWADGEKPADEDADDSLEDDSEDEDLGDDLADDDLFDEVVEDDGFDDGDAAPVESAEPEPEPATVEATADPEPAPEPEPETTTETRTESTTDDGATAESDDGKPYLATLPDGFAADLLVVEWLEYLLEQSSYRETSRAIDYYETIDWIDAAVADELQDHLRGFDDVDGGDGGLTIDHHTRSLHYISQLDGGGSEAAALSKLVRGGGADGLQR